jgi:hypothetical protein
MTLEINVGETSSVTPVISYTPDSIDEYMVVVNLSEDWSVVHNYIINENEIDGIPNRKIECSNDQSYSLRTSIYMMSAAEAEVLKTHSKVETVELNPHKYPQPQSLDTLRFKKDVAFNKPAITGTNSGSVVYNNGIRANWSMLFASEPSGAPYRGVGIGSTDTVNRDLSFSLTGKGVDAVTIDSGVGVIHPEFLDGNGKSRVRDVILDGPYKVDPDYFVGLGVTYNKVIDGVDIGVGIATTSAEEWWENTSKRSSKFSSLGTVSIPSTYTVGQAFSKTSSGESNPITGGHGTACASQIGGKSFGLAIEANLWNIRIALSGNGGVISGSTAIDVCTIWHNAKKINSTDPDPTILNNSWGSSSECGDSNGTSYNYWYRGSSSSYTGNNSDTTIQANIPCCVNKRHRYRSSTTSIFSGTYSGKGNYLNSGSTTSSAAENAIAAGCIVLASAGNNNQKLAHKDDVDFNNAYNTSTNYINRVGGVQQGFSGDHDKGKGSIRVGALDCAVEPSGEAQGVAKYTPRKVCYSSNGPMVDIWAPGDKTMSAGYASYESYQREDDSSFYDYWFGGTSAACPNTVSLVSLYLQSNRSANQDCVRHWLTNHASKEGVISDPYPGINDSAYWATETFDNPTTYWESYNYRGCGNLRGAPNRALFNPYASDVESSFKFGSTTSPPSSWTSTDATSGITWTAIAYDGNGTYVAVAWSGTGDKIMYSTDGINWTATADGNSVSWVGVAYGNGKFVAISDSGSGNNQIMYSTDGITWSNTSVSGVDSNYWEDITYGGGKFVAVSTSGTNRVMYSTNGISWTAASAAEANNWVDITYGNGYFVAVSTSGTNRTMYSTDAINWTAVSAAASNGWQSVIYGNGKFVAVANNGTNRVMYTTDPTDSWTGVSPSSGNYDSNGWSAIAYGGKHFVAVSTNGTTQTMYSSDAINWTMLSESTDADWIGIVYGDNKFVALAQSGSKRVMYTNTGDDFTTKPLTLKMGGSNTPPDNWTAISGIEESNWRGICYGNGKFVATSLTGTNRVTYSTDGINWTAASASEQHYWYGVAYGNGKYVAVGTITGVSNDVDRVMYSTNGINWTTANATYNHNWSSVCYGNGYFVAVAQNDGGTSANKRIMYSTDGINWTAGPSMAQNGWKSVTYGGGKFVAVASSGSQRIMYASDSNLDSWSYATSSAFDWQSVTYGGGKFVAVATSGTYKVTYSTDGVSWTNATAAESNSWYGVTYGNGYFVAVSSGGTNRVMYSADGINWSSASGNTSSGDNNNPWYAIAYGGGKFVATQLMEGVGSSSHQFMYSTVDGFTTTSGGGRGLTIG